MSGVQHLPQVVEAVTEDIVDDDIVAFFDLLAQFDFEDKQREESGLNTGSPPTLESQY